MSIELRKFSEPIPKVQCLMCTYGRFNRVQRAVSCFLDQDYPNKELLILNNHPIPLETVLPNIKIFNEPGYPTLGHCRTRITELSSAELSRTFDDDDLFLPWTISQGVTHLKDGYAAWKPTKSWFSIPTQKHRLMGNSMEAAILYRTYIGKKYGFRLGGGDEHAPLLNAFGKEGGLLETDMGVMTSYIYRWGHGEWHISGSLGSSTVELRTENWKKHNQDTGEGKKLEKIDVSEYWRNLLKDVKDTFTPEEYERLKDKFNQYGVS